MMKRNELTTVALLQVGARFYKQSDKAKVKSVFQIMDTEKQIRTANQKHFACPVQYVDGTFEAHKTMPIPGNVPVIFLTSVITKEVLNA